MSLYLANQHREALDGISLLAIEDTLTLISGAGNYDNKAFSDAIRKGIPEIATQYGKVAAITSAEYYNLLRAEAARTTATAYVEFNASSTAYSAAAIAKPLDTSVNYGLQKLYYGDMGLDAVTSLFTGAVQKNVFDHSRQNTIGNTRNDLAFQTYKRVPKATACGWCKFKAVIIDSGDSTATISDDGFHNNCHCVIGVTFENELETKFRQTFFGTYEEEFKKAKTLISEGKVEGRTVPKGTPEYEKIVRKDLTAASREKRKASATYKAMSPAEKTKYRTNLENKAAQIAYKINNDIPLTELDNNIVKGWNYEVPTKISTPASASNTKDILSVMRKEFGYR